MKDLTTNPIPKTTIVDYTFLSHLKGPMFYLGRQRAAREHVQQKWKDPLWDRSPQDLYNVFDSLILGI